MFRIHAVALLLLASCAAPLGPVAGQRTSGECGIDETTIFALGME